MSERGDIVAAADRMRRQLMDARPFVVQFRGLDPEDQEQVLELIRLLYREVGGQDVLFVFHDASGAIVANPVDGGDIDVIPYDDRPK